MLNTLINQVDKNTFKIPFGWSNKIGMFYGPFIRAIWTNPDALKVILEKKGGTSRFTILYKFWALNNVTTLEQARATIPLCPFCQKELCIPASAMPDAERSRGWISGSCHQKVCAGKYKNSKTTQGMIRLHGVSNANDMEDMRNIKSELLKKVCQERGDEILKKRKETCQSHYGVSNVSQSQDIKIKKAMTTFQNYGVYNPDYSREINIERTKRVIESNAKKVIINGKEFKLLHPTEEEFLNILVSSFGTDIVNSNNYLFENHANCHVVDYDIGEKVFIELKSCFHFSRDETNTTYIASRLDIVQKNLDDSQRYILYMRDPKKGNHALVFNNHSIFRIFSSGTKEDIDEYFGRYSNMAEKTFFNIKNMDYQLMYVIRKHLDRYK